MPAPQAHQPRKDAKLSELGVPDTDPLPPTMFGAQRIAFANGQLNRQEGEQSYQGPLLYSEDLW